MPPDDNPGSGPPPLPASAQQEPTAEQFFYWYSRSKGIMPAEAERLVREFAPHLTGLKLANDLAHQNALRELAREAFGRDARRGDRPEL